MHISEKLIDQLVEGNKSTENILGEGGIDSRHLISVSRSVNRDLRHEGEVG